MAQGTAGSPFALKQEKKSPKRAFFGLALFSCVSVGLFLYAAADVFVKDVSPSVSISIDRTKIVSGADLITPQPPPEYKDRRKAGQDQEVEKGELGKGFFQAFSDDTPEVDPLRLKKNRTVDETLQAAFLNRPFQQEIKDSIDLESRKDLPEAPPVPVFGQKNAGSEPASPAREESGAAASRQPPPPDLIQSTLMKSLPSFAAIKTPKPKHVAAPLPAITPLPTLQVDSKFGLIPVISKTNETSFQMYSRPYDEKPKTPYIAVLVTGVGIRRNTTDAVLNSLPSEVSVSLSPYSDDLTFNAALMRKAGHETYLDLPMQRGSFPATDPGPLGLVSGLLPEVTRSRLHKTLGKGIAFGGLAASSFETFSKDNPQMQELIDEIVGRGLVFIEGTDDPAAPRFKNAVRPAVLIGDNFYRAALKARLEEAKQAALKKGRALVRVETTPISILVLLDWLNSVTAPEAEQPLTLVPVSYYVREVLTEK